MNEPATPTQVTLPLPTTRPVIINIIVITVALMSVTGMGVIAACLILQLKPDQVVFTAFVGLTTNVVGTLTGLLINTRTAPPILPSDSKE